MKKYYAMNSAIGKKAAIVYIFSLSGLSAAAQLKDCNAFLKGKYVEVGVNYNGAYGSSAVPPAGYHQRGATKINNGPSCTPSVGNGLGFVVDPAKDGWTDSSGTATRAYFGDFFMPGHPQEGWSIMTGTQSNCWNGNLSAPVGPGITGVNFSHTVAGSRIATVWRGMYDSLSINQRTVLDTGNTFFTIRVTINNLSGKTKKNIYYLRTVDPDNEVTATGNYVTLNKIEQQLPNPKNRTVISATGTTYADAYVAMGTKDLRAKCFINRKSLQPEFKTLDSMYAVDTTHYIYKEKDTLRSDVAINVVFKIDSLPPATSTVIIMSYMFRPSDIDTALEDEGKMPEDEPTAIFSASTGESGMKLAPNPFSNLLTLEGIMTTDKVLIYDINGKSVPVDWTDVNATTRRAGTSDLPSGMYIIRVEDENGRLTLKQMIQKQ